MILNSFTVTDSLVLGVSNSPRQPRGLCKLQVDLPWRGISPAAHWAEPGASCRWAGRWGASGHKDGEQTGRKVGRQEGMQVGRQKGR